MMVKLYRKFQEFWRVDLRIFFVMAMDFIEKTLPTREIGLLDLVLKCWFKWNLPA
jgi:hypothetical protein